MIYDFFTSSLIFNIVSFGLTILSLILAVVFYYRSLSRKIPCYDKRIRTIISPMLMYDGKFRVLFKDEAIKNLYTAYFIFWNNGRATITQEDVSAKDPLQVRITGKSKILAANILSENKKANNFQVLLAEDKKSGLFRNCRGHWLEEYAKG